ncbi:related to MUS-26 protein MUS-26, involved in DNA repair [Cephalotrichum gorgonifer]|uniref:Related to MUS-26 protein MUS-26, involved in DNA repair n=1 Tax=Cephalotrichum gorgonifer TaxID=2041049 RepID=A0AAE8MSZ8_9PEZI|nr:related to MUS-26 protein MUS-26, involved in DNA repair [Cephalotrichum gorgonifer]
MPSFPLHQANPLLSHFTTFLTASIHTILYHRALYPAETFLTTRSHNLPIHQSRHPALCAWISDAVASATAQIRSGSVRRVAVVLHAPPERGRAVVERWVFDLEGWPSWPDAPSGKESKGKERAEAGDEGDEERSGVNWVDVEEGLRGALRRISYAAEKAGPLPSGCTFTLAVELRDEAPAPIGHPQAWIPSEPNLQPGSSRSGRNAGGKTTPLRSVEAGPLFFECWVEEGDAQVHSSSPSSQEESQSQRPRGMPLA